MTIATQHIYESELILDPPARLFLSFEEKRKCLNHVFWTAFDALQKTKRVVLFVRDDDELEYLNYFISRYGLNELSLIIDGDNEEQLSYVVSRMKKVSSVNVEPDDLGIDAEEFKIKLEKLQENISQYYESCLGRASLVEAGLAVSRSSFPGLHLDLFPEVPLSEYRNKKALIGEAMSLYRPEYRYNDSFKIFNDSLFSEFNTEEVFHVIEDIAEELEKLEDKFDEFYQRLLTTVQKFSFQEIDSIKAKLRKLQGLMQSRRKMFDDTLDKKISFLSRELFEELGQPAAHTGHPSHDMGVLQKLLQEKINKNNDKVSLSMEGITERLNKNNSAFDPSALFEQCRKLMERINVSGIFRENVEKFCASFGHYRRWLKSMVQLIQKAGHLLRFEKGLLEWHVFMNKLSLTDRKIISKLLNSRSDWVSCFEDAYLKSFVKARTAELDNISKMHDPLLGLWHDYETASHRSISRNFHMNSAIDGNALSDISSWSQLWMQHASTVLQKFPLLIIKSGLSEKHGQTIIDNADKVIMLNCFLQRQSIEEKPELLISCYREDVEFEIFPEIKKLKHCETSRIKGTAFNVNRSAHFLAPSELNKLSSYIGQGIRFFRNDARIFQTKEYSIISLLGYDRNERLISHMQPTGIKEIFADDESHNLLPGLFKDTSKKLFVFIEDELLNPQMTDKLMHQKRLIEEIRTSGFNVVSLDNYKLLSQGLDEFDRIIEKTIGLSWQTTNA